MRKTATIGTMARMPSTLIISRNSLSRMSPRVIMADGSISFHERRPFFE